MTFFDQFIVACARHVHSTVELKPKSKLLRAVNAICNAGAAYERSFIDLKPLIDALEK